MIFSVRRPKYFISQTKSYRSPVRRHLPDFEVGKGVGGGEGGVLTCVNTKTSQIVSQSNSLNHIRSGHWFSFAGRITFNKRRHRALCWRFERRRFLSHFFVFTWVTRPYSVTVHYLLFTVYCALNWQLVS